MDPSTLQIPNVKAVKVTDYTDHAALVRNLQGAHTVLAFISPTSDPESRCQKALIDACVAAGVKRFAPSEWAGKVRSGIAMEKTVLEYALFQPGLLMDYLAHPCPPSKHMSTFPMFFDLVGARAIVVEDDLAPMVVTAANDVAKVVARAIDSVEPLSPHNGGGIVGEKTSMMEIIHLAERITGNVTPLSFLCFVPDTHMHSFQAKIPPRPSPRLRPTSRPIQI
ncbi:hypothetical protein T310_6116 [Rasamsonia emersonii CBS 393.64]|uniref:NmrA-like domain-containing protein n=1 Tax=Rasamsonia emersonii (strain ATCC 16479 / CBS 393.64 / IMI 116815) TaxID=1408163 RepID=A0A0F4YPV9_RASE3|nr:hypothetical protein T310_6116 [Rasamsonia emersonii CBS 393.64]KKA19886.1 hypothetical protein T310_6116 [Rasamsonia emersonii CBS 393.64]